MLLYISIAITAIDVIVSISECGFGIRSIVPISTAIISAFWASLPVPVVKEANRIKYLIFRVWMLLFAFFI